MKVGIFGSEYQPHPHSLVKRLFAKLRDQEAEIYVGSAGTAARFLVAMLAFSKGDYVVNSSNQMKKRPMQPLIETLRNAGACVECLEEEGHFPLHIVA